MAELIGAAAGADDARRISDPSRSNRARTVDAPAGLPFIIGHSLSSMTFVVADTQSAAWTSTPLGCHFSVRPRRGRSQCCADEPRD